jgi:hypothetical protein
MNTTISADASRLAGALSMIESRQRNKFRPFPIVGNTRDNAGQSVAVNVIVSRKFALGICSAVYRPFLPMPCVRNGNNNGEPICPVQIKSTGTLPVRKIAASSV